jgi:hypothetical protein
MQGPMDLAKKHKNNRLAKLLVSTSAINNCCDLIKLREKHENLKIS